MTDFRGQGRSGAVDAARTGSSSLSRRRFLQIGAAAAAGVGALAATPRPARADEWQLGGNAGGFATLGPDSELKLVHRITYGYTQAEYALAKKLGYAAYLEYQLAPEKIDDSACESLLTNHKLLRWSGKRIYDWYLDPGNVSIRASLFSKLEEGTIVRRISSKRQLHERMVEFWSDHFNVDVNDGTCRYFYIPWDRNVIRQYAMDTFPKLLSATAHHGNMCYYLDNYTNRVGKAQENYARELLELHTLGVDNGYTQKDVAEVARCFTGWSYQGSTSSTFGDYRYINSYHDQKPKTVLGNTIYANGGYYDGAKVLNWLSVHPNTAHFLATKLARYFLGYAPSTAVVNAVAQTYLKTGGDIRSMLRTLLTRSNVDLATPKLRRPAHYAVSILRALDARVYPLGDRVNRFGTTLATLGQQPHRWPTPDGYPDSLEAWGQALLPRWTFASDLCDGRVSWAKVDPVRAIAQAAGGLAPGRQAAAIAEVLGRNALTEEEVLKLQMFIDQRGATTQTFRDALALAASMPGFQWF